MVEEKIIRLNFRKKMRNIPRWKRKVVFSKLIRKSLKNDKLKISQNLNQKIWSLKTPKIRLKITKDEKSAKAEFVE